MDTMLKKRGEKRALLDNILRNQLSLDNKDEVIKSLKKELRKLDRDVLDNAVVTFPLKKLSDLRKEYDIPEPSVSAYADKSVGISVQQCLDNGLLSAYIDRARKHMLLDVVYKTTVLIITKKDGSILTPFFNYWGECGIKCSYYENNDHWLVYMSW
jgi:hypothetical protein